MARQPSLTRVPTSLQANDERSLTQLMIKTNLKYKKEFQYFDIQKVGSKWVAWFYFDFNKEAQKGEY